MFKFIRQDNNPYKRLYPSLQARLFSVLVDVSLAVIVLICALNVVDFFGYNLTTAYRWKIVNNVVQKPYNFKGWMISQIVQMALFGGAIFIFWLKKYATPGKMLLSMKIVDAKTFNDPSVFQLVVRLCAYVISFLPLGLGIFYIALNKKHRAWHDIISGTIVVNTKELEKYPAHITNEY